MNIVLVDDDIQLLDMMALLLKRAGHTVTASPGGIAVLSQIRKNPPDMVITDLMMAELDGLEFCREINRDQAIPTKVAMISARTDRLWKERARDAGAIGYIEKPIHRDTFVDEIERIYNAS